MVHGLALLLPLSGVSQRSAPTTGVAAQHVSRSLNKSSFDATNNTPIAVAFKHGDRLLASADSLALLAYYAASLSKLPIGNPGAHLAAFTISPARFAAMAPTGFAVPPSRAADDVLAFYRQNLLLLDVIGETQPLSWIAPGGEISPRHQAPFGADAKPHYLFSAQLGTSFIAAGSQNRRWALTIDPRFVVRMQLKPSLPVRTPSYHIGGWYHYRLRAFASSVTEVVRFGSAADGYDAVSQTWNKLGFKILKIGIFHYSNGQEGEVFTGGSAPIPNELNGSFSTNALHLGYVSGWSTHYRFVSTTLFGQWGPAGVIDRELHGRYNISRVGVSKSYRWYRSTRFILREAQHDNRKGKLPQVALADSAQAANYTELSRRNKERFRLDFTASYGLSSLGNLAPDDRGLKKRLNAEATFVWVPSFMSQTGLLFTAGYYGEDPYNIWYLHRYPFCRVGIATTPFKNTNQIIK
jgi:hypothetical protein